MELRERQEESFKVRQTGIPLIFGKLTLHRPLTGEEIEHRRAELTDTVARCSATTCLFCDANCITSATIPQAADVPANASSLFCLVLIAFIHNHLCRSHRRDPEATACRLQLLGTDQVQKNLET
jgi:hypothetical protein